MINSILNINALTNTNSLDLSKFNSKVSGHKKSFGFFHFLFKDHLKFQVIFNAFRNHSKTPYLFQGSIFIELL